MSTAGLAERARRVSDALLLRGAIADARSRPAEVVRAVRRLCRLADRRVRVAEDLAESDPGAAFTLLRDAAALLAAALVAEARGRPPVAVVAADVLRELRALEPDAVGATPPAGAEALLASDAAVDAVDAMPLELRAVRVRDAAAQIAALRARLHPRTPLELRLLGLARTVVAAALVLAVVVFATVRAFAPRNVAEGCPVVASSQFPGTPPASGFTNGALEVSFGVHTSVEPNAWISVDLGRERTLARAVVYGRGDGFQAEGVPLELETSLDGAAWTLGARRDRPFSRSDPWRVALGGRSARYVRVRRPASGYVALTELEVFEGR